MRSEFQAPALNLSLQKVGIVGSGQIGPDIALHMTKVLHSSGISVVVVDVAQKALDQGRAKLDKKIARGVTTGAFTPEQAESMRSNVAFSLDYALVEGAELVVEAASENLELKRRIFRQLESLVSDSAVLASNSSHLEPERIFAPLASPARGLVIHYFFPAERNPLVEIVPAEATNPEVVKWLLRFYEAIGKVPIEVASRYGYAIDPIFEGLFQAAALCVEEGLGSPKEVDRVAQRRLGLGVGPFTAMNLTGGNPITAHGLDEMHERVHPWFRTPSLMHEALERGAAWQVAGRDEVVEVDTDRENQIGERMEGAYFGLVGEVLDSEIVSLANLEVGAQIGLAIEPPFEMMNRVGVDTSLERVDAFRAVHEEFPRPKCLVSRASENKPWEVPYILRRDMDGVAVLTIRRPAVLNALNLRVYGQLSEHLARIAEDAEIRGVVITGFGRKAFVSGADIGMLAKIQNRADAESASRASHQVMNQIAAFEKPVVCAYNGLAFGGGNELGMACHVRLARRGLSVLAAQPEPNLGIIPGAGATQRLPRIIGISAAWRLLRTGRPVSSDEALELGLIQQDTDEDLLDFAVGWARDIASGKRSRPSIEQGPISVPELADVDIGHRSRAVDAVLRRVILEGAEAGLQEGLEMEIRAFGEVFELEDMRLGVAHFMQHGPRSKPSFEHR